MDNQNQDNDNVFERMDGSDLEKLSPEQRDHELQELNWQIRKLIIEETMILNIQNELQDKFLLKEEELKTLQARRDELHDIINSEKEGSPFDK